MLGSLTSLPFIHFRSLAHPSKWVAPNVDYGRAEYRLITHCVPRSYEDILPVGSHVSAISEDFRVLYSIHPGKYSLFVGFSPLSARPRARDQRISLLGFDIEPFLNLIRNRRCVAPCGEKSWNVGLLDFGLAVQTASCSRSGLKVMSISGKWPAARRNGQSAHIIHNEATPKPPNRRKSVQKARTRVPDRPFSGCGIFIIVAAADH